jgi:hypothetical protein
VKDYYSLLKVNPDANPLEIDTAYRRLMQRYHPNARTSTHALDRMRELNEAWRVLSDATQRAAYDRALANGTEYNPPAPPPTLRNIPQANLTDFGARRSSGGTCFVFTAVAVVLFIALGILAWGLNEQLNLYGWFENVVGEVNTLLPTQVAIALEPTEEPPTPTPDPRCRDGCETPPAGCVVKGDVEADGSRYFYLPNDAGYGRVAVDIARGDRWFCALNDAQSAGWARKAPTETPTMPPPPDAMTTAVSRRVMLVCGENVALHEGPGDGYSVAQTAPNGTRLSVTGVSGEWSVATLQDRVVYVRTALLCAPTRAPAPPTSNAPPAVEAATAPAPAFTAVANSATSAFKYPAPQIVTPSDGSRYWCSRELVLEWSLPTGALGANEFFLVESKPAERERWDALADWTQTTTVTLFPSKGDGECDAMWWENTGVYQWRISVVTGNKELPTYLSPFSELYHINYGQ